MGEGSKNMESFKVGDILFYETSSLVGAAIRKVTKFKYSHVALVIDNESNVIEADAFIKSRKINFWDTEFKRVKVMRLKEPLTKEQEKAIKENSELLIGKRYDYKGVFLLFLKLLFGLKLDREKDDLSRVWCSEIVDYLYITAGIDLVPNISNHFVTIEDLFNSPKLIEVDEIVYE
jgi:hypothetical protein